MTVPEGTPTVTMKYMNRFGCIGPACEDTCCAGWRIDVDPKRYEGLLAMAQFSSRPIASRMRAAIRVVPPKKKKEKERYMLKLTETGDCVFLDEIGLCEIHKNFGIKALWDVCAFYPRKLKWVGPVLELSATASCPEVARMLLLAQDGADPEPIDMSRLERHVLQDGMDPRDRRPFYRAYLSLREFMDQLFRDTTLSLEQKYFLMAWFSKRTNEVLKKHKDSGDLEVVEREMTLLRKPEVRAAILSRYEQLETPAALIIWIIRAIVKPWRKDKIRSHWGELVDQVIGSYQPALREMLPGPDADEAEHERRAKEDSTSHKATTGEVWNDYCVRRDRMRAIAPLAARMEHWFRNYTLHTWFHKFPTEEEDILHYALRTLVQHACIRFIIISHPLTTLALDAYDASPKDEAATQTMLAEIDKVAIIAFQKIARHTEHGVLLKHFNKMLKETQLFSIAGAVYLIRF
ncbi:MAG: flagellin lysine-N-methylase [Myxococcota bacterium]